MKCNRTNWIGRLLAMLLILTMLLPTKLPTAAMATQEYTGEFTGTHSHGFAEDEAWKKNILTKNPLKVLTKKKEKIVSVTFYDNFDDAPTYIGNPRYLGQGSSPKVLGWIEWSSGYAYVHIAAEGGINAKNACYELFRGCNNLEEVEFNGAFHTDEVTTMQGMFRDCKDLDAVDVSSFNTENVKSMNSMFATCTTLTELDLSNFDTSKVTNMAYMFSSCRNLEYVDVSSFDTSKVTRMEVMFRWCTVLEEPDLSGWNVSRVKNYSKFMNDDMYINGEPWKQFFK